MKTFHLTIASVGQTFYDGEAASATLPGSSGVLTILPHHEPFVTTLAAGAISVRTKSGETKEFENENGILECAGNRAVVLL